MTGATTTGLPANHQHELQRAAHRVAVARDAVGVQLAGLHQSIRAAAAGGMSYTRIAQLAGMSRGRVGQIVNPPPGGDPDGPA